MSLLRYFTASKGKEKATSEGDSIPNTEDSLGTAEGKNGRKRVRAFQESWQSGRPWLEYEGDTNTMFCSYCKRFALDKSSFGSEAGCSTFRLDGIKKHKSSVAHSRAEVAFQNNSLEPGTAPLEACLLNMEKEAVERLMKLFHTTYYLVQAERPFSDLAGLCSLQERNGVMIGRSYRNDKQSATFAHFIAEIVKEDLASKLRQVEFFSVLNDSSTDVSVTDEELVYVRYLEDGRPVTKFLSLQAMAKSDAQGILGAIDKAFLDELGLQGNEWREKIVGMGTDGAAVMTGVRSGVVTRVKADVPHLISVHCVAHRLELGIKDSLKQVAYLAKIDDFLLSIYKFYSYSPLNWQNLKETGIPLNVKVLKPVNVKGTRWIPHHERAVKVVKHNWPCLLAHLDSVSQHGQSNDAKAKATGFLRLLRSFQFVHFFHFFLDICTILARMSLTFQANDTSIENVSTSLTATVSAVRALSDRPGSNEAVFLEEVGDGTVYKGHDLQGDKDAAMERVRHNKQAVVNATAAHLQRRFSSFSEDPIFRSMSVFDFKNWPMGLEPLQNYGNGQLRALVTHFEELLERNNCNTDAVPLEWNELKLYVARLVGAEPAVSYLDLWQRVIRQNEERFQNIALLVKIVLLIPVHTSEVERGFSLMNRVKQDWRARLTSPTLNELMRVRLLGPSCEEFDPMRAIRLWWQAGRRSRRPHIQPYGPRARQLVEPTDVNEEEGLCEDSDGEEEV